MGKRRNAYRILVGNPEEKRPLRRPRRRWVDNIKMDVREIGRMVWTGLIWLRIGPVEVFCEHGNEPTSSIKCWEVLE
jgi:hypothetical protein